MLVRHRNFTRGRRVTGTLNNPTALERAHFVALATDAGHDPRVKYLVFQSEVGATGVHHIQFYCIFTESMRARTVHGILGPRCHFDASRGTPAQNKHYCLKPLEGCECVHCRDARLLPNLGREVAPAFMVGEYGIMRRPRVQKLSAVVEMMDTGSTLAEILDAHPEMAIKYRNGISNEFARRLDSRDWAMEIEIFVGETGTGKSFTAKAENPGSISIPWPTGGRWWWPGYTGQNCVLLDDFRSGNITVLTMMRLFDRGEMSTEAKGTNFPFVSHKIVITTNVDPTDWYQMTKLVESKGQDARKVILAPLARRISEFATIYDFAGTNVFPNFVKVARPKGDPVADRLTWFKFNDAAVANFAATDDRNDQMRVYGS